MNLADIRAEVERQVAEQLPVVIFDRVVLMHRKSGIHRGCWCSYCKLKRRAEMEISNAHYVFRDDVRTAYRLQLSAEMEKVVTV